jgi:acetoin:2,6-dichlorophenolindophenol oxidoreductase subunit alpha
MSDLPADAQLELFRKMTVIRLFEKRAYDLFMQNLVKGTTHLGTGQEAVAAGVSQAMNADDYTFTTYRGHNHVIARGTPLTPIMAELLGRENGLMRGKGGSMHLLDVSHGILGAYAIIGAQLVIANGSAWSAQYRGTGQVTVVFLGDGATNIGAFHEALNFAVVWQLPVVFVCENNHYMEYTAIGSVTAVKRPAADRAASYGLEPIVVDGNDVEAVYDTAKRAIDKARAGQGPSLIEADTYRHGGHSRADPGKYRPKEEVAEWLKKDPIPRYRQVLLDRGVDEPTLAEIEKTAREAVDRATEEAKAGPEPRLELASTNVWADGGHSWRNLHGVRSHHAADGRDRRRGHGERVVQAGRRPGDRRRAAA